MLSGTEPAELFDVVVGLFNDSFDPIMDGVGVCVRNYAYWMAKQGGNPIVVAPSIPKYEDDYEFTVLRYRSVQLPVMAPYRAGLPGLDPEFLRKVYNVEFDLVHAHCPFVSGSIALKIARKRRIPIVATFHSKYREDLRKALYFEKTADLALSYIIRFYQAVDYVWVPSEATARTLSDYGYEGPSEVMPNGADLAIPSPDEYAEFRRSGRELLGAPSGLFVFLFVGQHRWEKNVRLVIDAMKVLSERAVRFRMVFAGTGYAEKEMKKLVNQYRLDDRVQFLGSITDRERIRQLYAAADLFLFPSMYDNVPLVVREAAAFALPSVLAAHSSASEGVEDGVNGFLTENNVEGLVETLTRVMQSPAVLRRAGDGARKTIYVSWEQVVERVLQRYESIGEDFRRFGGPGSAS